MIDYSILQYLLKRFRAQLYAGGSLNRPTQLWIVDELLRISEDYPSAFVRSSDQEEALSDLGGSPKSSLGHPRTEQ